MNDLFCPLYETRHKKLPSSSPKIKAKDPWKYIEPKDLSQPVTINGKNWYFCTLCKCRATGKTGFYQLSHTNDTHDPNWKPEGNLTPIQDPDPSPAPAIRPPPDHQPLEDDDLIFTGVHHSPVILDTLVRAERKKECVTSEGKLNQILKMRINGGLRRCLGTTHVVDATNFGISKNIGHCNCSMLHSTDRHAVMSRTAGTILHEDNIGCGKTGTNIPLGNTLVKVYDIIVTKN